MFIGTWDFNIHIWLYDRVQYGFGSNIMIFHNFLGPRGLNLWPSMRFGYPCWCDHDTSAWRPVSKKGSHTCSGLYDFMIVYDILWWCYISLWYSLWYFMISSVHQCFRLVSTVSTPGTRGWVWQVWTFRGVKRQIEGFPVRMASSSCTSMKRQR